MLRRQKQVEAPPQARWLTVDAGISGTLTFKDAVNLQINGEFEGTLDTRGNLSIGERAVVKSTIHGEVITIAGTVDGQITASSRVELFASARVTGKIVSPRIIMQDGSVFHGAMEMPAGDRGRTDWMDAQDLASFLEVDAATVSKWAQEGRLPAQKQGDSWRFERAKIDEWLAQEKVR